MSLRDTLMKISKDPGSILEGGRMEGGGSVMSSSYCDPRNMVPLFSVCEFGAFVK